MKFCHVRLEYRGVADSAIGKLRLLQGLSRLLYELNEAIHLQFLTLFCLSYIRKCLIVF